MTARRSTPEPETVEPTPEPVPTTVPTNRAARRGKARHQVPDQASRLPATGHARPAQGRRVNPVRRTG